MEDHLRRFVEKHEPATAQLDKWFLEAAQETGDPCDELKDTICRIGVISKKGCVLEFAKRTSGVRVCYHSRKDQYHLFSQARFEEAASSADGLPECYMDVTTSSKSNSKQVSSGSVNVVADIKAEQSVKDTCQAYNRELGKDLSNVLEYQEKNAPPDPALNPLTKDDLKEHLRYFAFDSWNSARPGIGVSPGAWRTACEMYFEQLTTGEQTLASIFGTKNLKLKEFCHFPHKWTYRGASKGGVNVWNSKGNPWCYHNMVFLLINKYGEKDVEYFARGERAQECCAWCEKPKIVGRKCREEDGGCFTCFSCWTDSYGGRSYPWTDQGYQYFLANKESFRNRGSHGGKKKNTVGARKEKGDRRKKK